MKNFKLFRKRDVIRNTADYESHFIITFREAPFGIYLSGDRLAEKSLKENMKEIKEAVKWLKT